MKASSILITIYLLCSGIAALSAAIPDRIGDSKQNIPPYPLELANYGTPWVTDDRNGDGTIDHAVLLGKNGLPSAEVYDFNFDGFMDDFYVYENGAVTSELLDSNYDGKIDIWVHVYQGIYVAGYERDNNFDGKLDIVKTYGRDTLVKR